MVCVSSMAAPSAPSIVANLGSIRKSFQRTLNEGEEGPGRVQAASQDWQEVVGVGGGTHYPLGNQGSGGHAPRRKLHPWALPRDKHMAQRSLEKVLTCDHSLTLLKAPRKLCPWGGQEMGEAGTQFLLCQSCSAALPPPTRE